MLAFSFYSVLPLLAALAGYGLATDTVRDLLDPFTWFTPYAVGALLLGLLLHRGLRGRSAPEMAFVTCVPLFGYVLRQASVRPATPENLTIVVMAALIGLGGIAYTSWLVLNLFHKPGQLPG